LRDAVVLADQSTLVAAPITRKAPRILRTRRRPAILSLHLDTMRHTDFKHASAGVMGRRNAPTAFGMVFGAALGAEAIGFGTACVGHVVAARESARRQGRHTFLLFVNTRQSRYCLQRARFT
jgi:hypothetical protein